MSLFLCEVKSSRLCPANPPGPSPSRRAARSLAWEETRQDRLTDTIEKRRNRVQRVGEGRWRRTVYGCEACGDGLGSTLRRIDAGKVKGDSGRLIAPVMPRETVMVLMFVVQFTPRRITLGMNRRDFCVPKEGI
jgi:hypothetical protein